MNNTNYATDIILVYLHNNKGFYDKTQNILLEMKKDNSKYVNAYKSKKEYLFYAILSLIHSIIDLHHKSGCNKINLDDIDKQYIIDDILAWNHN